MQKNFKLKFSSGLFLFQNINNFIFNILNFLIFLLYTVRNGIKDLNKKLNLSPRETEIMILMSHGLQNKEIANALNISARTIETHNKRIYIKMKARNRSNAVYMFIKAVKINN